VKGVLSAAAIRVAAVSSSRFSHWYPVWKAHAISLVAIALGSKIKWL